MGQAAPVHSGVRRETVEGFYKALTTRDFTALKTFLHENVTWKIGGPVDLLIFCGDHHGREAVFHVVKNVVTSVLRDREFVPDFKVIEGDRVASLGRLHATHIASGRYVSYRMAHFVRFENEQVIEFVSVLDSFDAAEQFLGHRIEATGDLQNGNVVAL